MGRRLVHCRNGPRNLGTPNPVSLSKLILPQDAGYCLGRPHTMEGGALHWPFYVPYVLYSPKYEIG
jgi:hypothetical protein